MPRQSRFDADAVHAAARDGVISRQTLLRLGVTDDAIHHRCAAGGPWQRLYPGVLLLTAGAPTRGQWFAAALCYAGNESVLTGISALQLHGLRTLPAGLPDHVLVPQYQQCSSVPGLRVQRTHRSPSPELRGARMRCAPYPRAVMDAARALRDADEVRGLLSRVVQRRLVTLRELQQELDDGPCQGSALPRAALRELWEGTRSVEEARALRLLQRSGLPAAMWNASLRSQGGDLLGVIDCWFDEVGLAWEIDSLQHHLSVPDHEATMARHNRLTAAGVTVVHTVPRQLRSDPNRVLRELRAAYASCSDRPRPPLTAEPAIR